MSAERLCLLNDRLVAIAADEGGLVLDWLRARPGLKGTREGCGEGECGACAVLLGEIGPDGLLTYRAVASCLLPVAELPGRHLVTIEGLNPPAGLNPIQEALVEAAAPQCGFCFSGIVVSLAGHFLGAETIDPAGAAAALDGNICRCTGYASIRRALAALCAEQAAARGSLPERLPRLVERGFLPAHFGSAETRLRELAAAPPAAAPGAQMLAGGTDLLLQRPELLAEGGFALASRDPDLAGIRSEDGGLRIGAGVTIEALRRDPAFRARVPDAADFLALFGSTLIRSRATVAGNLVNASPIGDLTLLLLALGAELHLASAGERRRLPLSRFYLGYKQLDLGLGERLEAVHLPPAVGAERISLEKVSQRRMLDIAAVNSVLRIRCKDGVTRDAALAVGGVAPVPLLATAAARALIGRPLDAAAVRAAAIALDGEIAPIDDVRGSAAYKRELARRLLFAHALRLAPDALHYEELV